MAKINFPNNRDQLNPPLPTGALQDGDTTNITADGVTITYVYKKPASPNTDSWWKSMGRVNNATPIDKIEEGDSSVEVIDSGSNGQVVVTTDGTARAKFRTDGHFVVGGNLDTDPAVELTDDGKGMFTNNVSVGDVSATSTYTFIDDAGLVETRRSDTDVAVNVITTSSSTASAQIKADGTAIFGSGVIQLGPDGGGYLICGGNPVNGSEEGTALAGVGQITACGNLGTDTLWQGWKKSAGANSSQILANGSATFTNDVTTTTRFLAGSNGYGATGVSLNASVGAIYAHPSGLSAAAFQVYSGTGGNASDVEFQISGDGTTVLGGAADNPNITLNANGSAIFKSYISTQRSSNIVNINVDVGGTDIALLCSPNGAAGDYTALIKGDGTIVNSGVAGSRNDLPSPDSNVTKVGCHLGGGKLTVSRGPGSGKQHIWQGFVSNSATETSAIWTDGSAKFTSVQFPTGTTSIAGQTVESNTLDDYEEGTFTPTLTMQGSGSVTVDGTLNTFAYTKVGRKVTVTGLLGIASVSSPVGSLLISLPFSTPSANAATFQCAGSVTYFDDDGGSGDDRYTAAPSILAGNTNNLKLTMESISVTPGANDQIMLSLTYFTNS